MANKQKDPRYEVVRVLLQKKKITTFQDIFKHIPRTVVALDLHTNNNRMKKLITYPGKLKLEDILKMADLFKIDLKKMLALILNNYHPE